MKQANLNNLANLRAFFEESRAALPPLDGLGLKSNPPTAAPSRPRTPRQRPIYLNDEFIGRGEFGEVRRVIHASNGQFYAAKTFYSPFPSQYNNRKRKLDEENWLDKIRKENPHVSATHMSGLIIRKPNTMQVIEFYETPKTPFSYDYI